jgi:hypothetical protein
MIGDVFLNTPSMDATDAARSGISQVWPPHRRRRGLHGRGGLRNLGAQILDARLHQRLPKVPAKGLSTAPRPSPSARAARAHRSGRSSTSGCSPRWRRCSSRPCSMHSTSRSAGSVRYQQLLSPSSPTRGRETLNAALNLKRRYLCVSGRIIRDFWPVPPRWYQSWTSNRPGARRCSTSPGAPGLINGVPTTAGRFNVSPSRSRTDPVRPTPRPSRSRSSRPRRRRPLPAALMLH